jgi:hypothetical protein
MLNQGNQKNLKLHQALISALTRRLGPSDKKTLHSIIGFEMGGPPDLLIFRKAPDINGVTYVTTELIFCEHQPPNSIGRYELAISLPAENKWAEHILFKLSQASLEMTFNVGNTIDIGEWVEPECQIKGFFITRLLSFKLDNQPYCVLFFVGVTQAELNYAIENKAHQEVAVRLKEAGAFPVTNLQRQSII